MNPSQLEFFNEIEMADPLDILPEKINGLSIALPTKKKLDNDPMADYHKQQEAKFDEQNSKTKTDRVLQVDQIPEEVAKKYHHVANTKEAQYILKDRDNKVAFVDRGNRMMTSENDADIIRSMIDVSKQKCWTKINLKGTEEFRREAWLQASLDGLEVKGYDPNDIDLAKLAELQKARMTNQITQDLEPAKIPDVKKEPMLFTPAVEQPAQNNSSAKLPEEEPPMTKQGIVYGETLRAQGASEQLVQRAVKAMNEAIFVAKQAGLVVLTPKVYDPKAPVAPRAKNGVVVGEPGQDIPVPIPQPKLNMRR